MTHKAEIGGRFPFNASIDRIDPKRGYEKGNVQLVADFVNIFKKTTSIEQTKKQLDSFIEQYLAANLDKRAKFGV